MGYLKDRVVFITGASSGIGRSCARAFADQKAKILICALSKGLRLDLSGTPIRVSEVSPGMVETEFSLVRFHGDAERADKVYQGLEPLSPDDIAEAAVWCATRPAHVNVSEVIVMPTAQASTTLVHRK